MTPLDQPPRARTPGSPEYERLRRRLTIAFLALVGVTLFGVVGYRLLGGDEYSLIDAVYMTVITLTTVGFNEIINMENNPAARVFTIVLLMGGMGTVAYAVPMLAAFVMEGQLGNIFAKRRMQKAIDGMTNQYIVAGDTAATWYSAAELVKTDRQVVVVVPNEDLERECREHIGAQPIVVGDPSDDDVLHQAGIERASGVIVSMAEDKDAVLTVISARRLNNTARIVAATIDQETFPKLQVAGADTVVSPSQIGGLRIASELVRPKVVNFLDHMLRDQGALRVEEVRITSTEHLKATTIGGLNIDGMGGAVLLAVRQADGDVVFKPHPETVVTAGQTLIVMADGEGRNHLSQAFAVSI